MNKFSFISSSIISLQKAIKYLFLQYFFFRHSNSLYRSFGYTDKSILIGTTLFFDFIEPLTYAFEILKLKLTRKFEF